MTAFALSLAVFSLWFVLGWSLVSVLGSRRNLLRNALLAPAVGVAALTLLLFELYRLGIPVRIGGPMATLIALGAAGALLWRARVPVPQRAILPFIGLLLLAALLTGRPMLRYGFDWVSFCNDDMANYVLGARAMLTRGYLSPVTPADLVGGHDPGVIFWVLSTLAGVRCGSELVLAWVMSCVRINGHQAFMPTILSLHLVLISAGSALVCARRRYRTAALVAGGWLALSSLMSLGAVYQLIAQVFGLALLASAAALLLSPRSGTRRAALVRRALLAAILVAALGVSYPEVSPFLALAFGLYHAVAVARGRESWKALCGFVALIGGLAVVLLNTYFGSVVWFLRRQIISGAAHGVLSKILFPYYLIPSGLAVFWGFQPITGRAPHPLIDIYIVIGACLLAAGVAASLWTTWRGEAAGAVATVMLAVAARLFVTTSDFGLFKLAMYLQPFLLGAMTLAWFSLHQRDGGRSRWTARRTAAFCAPIALIAAWGGPAQQRYVQASVARSSVASGFVEIPDATATDRDAVGDPCGQTSAGDCGIRLRECDTHEIGTPYLSPSSQWYPAGADYSVGGRDNSGILANGYANLVRPGYTAAVSALSMNAARGSYKQRSTCTLGGQRIFVGTRPALSGFPGQYTLVASGLVERFEPIVGVGAIGRVALAPRALRTDSKPPDLISSDLEKATTWQAQPYRLAGSRCFSRSRITSFLDRPCAALGGCCCSRCSTRRRRFGW